MAASSEERFIDWSGVSEDPRTEHTYRRKQYELRYIVKVVNSAPQERRDSYTVYYVRTREGEEAGLWKIKSRWSGHTKQVGEYKLFRCLLSARFDARTPLSETESQGSPFLAYVRIRR